jgi:hypothetical protein
MGLDRSLMDLNTARATNIPIHEENYGKIANAQAAAAQFLTPPVGGELGPSTNTPGLFKPQGKAPMAMPKLMPQTPQPSPRHIAIRVKGTNQLGWTTPEDLAAHPDEIEPLN